MSETRKGRPAWNSGKTNVFTQETLKKMSAAKRGKPRGAMLKQTREHISAQRTGKRWYKSPDNTQTTCCYPGDEPEGWIRGMIKSVKPTPPHLREKTNHEPKPDND